MRAARRGDSPLGAPIPVRLAVAREGRESHRTTLRRPLGAAALSPPRASASPTDPAPRDPDRQPLSDMYTLLSLGSSDARRASACARAWTLAARLGASHAAVARPRTRPSNRKRQGVRSPWARAVAELVDSRSFERLENKLFQWPQPQRGLAALLGGQEIGQAWRPRYGHGWRRLQAHLQVGTPTSLLPYWATPNRRRSFYDGSTPDPRRSLLFPRAGWLAIPARAGDLSHVLLLQNARGGLDHQAGRCPTSFPPEALRSERTRIRARIIAADCTPAARRLISSATEADLTSPPFELDRATISPRAVDRALSGAHPRLVTTAARGGYPVSDLGRLPRCATRLRPDMTRSTLR